MRVESPESAAASPRRFALHANASNPFNPEILYRLPAGTFEQLRRMMLLK